MIDDEIRQHIHSLPDDQLVAMLTNACEYAPEALQMGIAEADRRGLEKPEPTPPSVNTKTARTMPKPMWICLVVIAVAASGVAGAVLLGFSGFFSVCYAMDLVDFFWIAGWLFSIFLFPVGFSLGAGGAAVWLCSRKQRPLVDVLVVLAVSAIILLSAYPIVDNLHERDQEAKNTSMSNKMPGHVR